VPCLDATPIAVVGLMTNNREPLILGGVMIFVGFFRI
jgi:hypothetical protein